MILLCGYMLCLISIQQDGQSSRLAAANPCQDHMAFATIRLFLSQTARATSAERF
jgi:hypothetical protein